MSSPLKDFHLAAQDYLQLLAKKSKQAQVNSEAAKELEVLDSFYEMITGLLQRVEMDIHGTRLLSINETAKAKILESELRQAYNTIYLTGNSELLAKVMKSTNLKPRKA